MTTNSGLKFEKDLYFDQLKHFEVIDVDNKVIGKTRDAILSSKDFSILALITYKGLLEEKLEEIHLKEDHSILVPSEAINTIDEDSKKIILKISKGELLNAGDQLYNSNYDTINYSKLRKMRVYLAHLENIGYPVSILFKSDGLNILIVGGKELEHFLKEIRKPTNTYLKVSIPSISKITDAIYTTIRKNEIIDAFNNSEKYMEFYHVAVFGSLVYQTDPNPFIPD